jgi:hypothetical protein
MSGSALPIAKAQARPATTANPTGRTWGRIGVKLAAFDVMFVFLQLLTQDAARAG